MSLTASPDTADPPAQPPDSRCTLTYRPDGLTLAVPPSGYVGGARSLRWFSVIWLGLCGLMTAILLAAAIGKGDPKALIGVAFMLVFWAVGLFTLILARTLARRQAIFDVVLPAGGGDRGTLLVTHQSPISGLKQRDWPVVSLKTVRVGDSGMQVNNRDILELQIVPGRGGKKGYLAGRDEAELRWIAAILRQAMGLSE